MSASQPTWQMPPKREFLGGDLLAQTLKYLGAEVFFGVHGGHLDAFLVGCHLADIKVVDTRHETTAVQAAEGYAKLSGKIGNCFITANSGFANGLPGIATAFADRSPIFVVTSSPPLRDAETNCLQGFHDQVVLAKPVTKFAHRVTNVEEIPRIVSHAYRVAHGGTPGPVVVDFPIDVLFSPPRMSAICCGSLMSRLTIPPFPDPAALDELVSMWKLARRPAIIVGTGAARTTKRGEQTSPLLRLAEETQTPVFYSQKYAPALPHDSPLRGGSAGCLAGLSASRPDFILLLGARTGFLLGGRSGAVIPNTGCQLVQVDIDADEIGKSHAIDLGIVSDALKFVTSLADKLTVNNPIPRHDDWLADIKALKEAKSPYIRDAEKRKDGRLHPYFAFKTMFESLPEGSVVMIDGGEAGIWALDLVEHARPSAAIVSTGYLGFLGNGWGYSIGAALAAPDRLVVNMQGDGSAGFHLQELDTFARHKLRILTVVMNNSYWGLSVAGQDLIYGSEDPARVASKLSDDCRYDVIAQGSGCQGRLVHESTGELRDAVRKLTSTTSPALLNVIISKDPVTMAAQAMVGKTEDKDLIVIPYYDNVPRPYYNESQPAQNGCHVTE